MGKENQYTREKKLPKQPDIRLNRESFQITHYKYVHEVKESTIKEVKEGMITISHLIYSINKNMGIIKEWKFWS